MAAVRVLIVSALFAVALAGCTRAPTLRVPRCPATAQLTPFELDSGSGRPLQQTTAFVCWNDDFLVTRFVAADNNVASQYTKCNEPLYTQDVVEMFVAPAQGSATTKNYFEVCAVRAAVCSAFVHAYAV